MVGAGRGDGVESPLPLVSGATTSRPRARREARGSSCREEPGEGWIIASGGSAEAAPPVVAWVWATVLVSSLAMLAAASRGGVLVFWANTKAPEGQVQGQPAPSPAEMAPLIGAIGLTVLLTVFAEPVKGYMDRAAAQTLDFVFGPQKPPHDYAVAGGAMAAMRPSHFYATSTDLVALRHDMPALETRHGEIAVPCGILFGSADRVLNHRRHGLAVDGRIAGLDLEIAEGIGHMLQYAETERVVAFIRRIAARAFPA